MPNNCKKIEKIKSSIRVVLSFVLTFVTVSSVSKNEKIVNEYLSKRYSIKKYFRRRVRRRFEKSLF